MKTVTAANVTEINTDLEGHYKMEIEFMYRLYLKDNESKSIETKH